jgi:hypothetical protein
MGQQQLLLLVFGVIIVGVAVIAGLDAVSSRMEQANADRLIDRNLVIASNATYWKTLKDPYNGGNASYAGLATNGLAKLALESVVANNEYAITSATQSTLQITGVSLRNPDLGVRTYISGHTVDSTVVRFDGSITIP